MGLFTIIVIYQWL